MKIKQASKGHWRKRSTEYLKKLAGRFKLAQEIVQQISGHSMRVGAGQDMLIIGENLAKIMQRGRWSKTDTVMRYVENAIFT